MMDELLLGIFIYLFYKKIKSNLVKLICSKIRRHKLNYLRILLMMEGLIRDLLRPNR